LLCVLVPEGLGTTSGTHREGWVCTGWFASTSYWWLVFFEPTNCFCPSSPRAVHTPIQPPVGLLAPPNGGEYPAPGWSASTSYWWLVFFEPTNCFCPSSPRAVHTPIQPPVGLLAPPNGGEYPAPGWSASTSYWWLVFFEPTNCFCPSSPWAVHTPILLMLCFLVGLEQGQSQWTQWLVITVLLDPLSCTKRGMKSGNNEHSPAVRP